MFRMEVEESVLDADSRLYRLVREMGAASTVLLKNVNGSLPLEKPITISLIGT